MIQKQVNSFVGIFWSIQLIEFLLISYLHLEGVESVWLQVGDNVTDLESDADGAAIATTVGRKKLESEKKFGFLL